MNLPGDCGPWRCALSVFRAGRMVGVRRWVRFLVLIAPLVLGGAWGIGRLTPVDSVTATATPTATVGAVRPVGTTSPSSPGVPPVSAEAQAAGFIDVRTVVPDALIDLRYATTNNFTKVQLYPSDARCLVHQSMAPGLTAAANALRPQGQVLVFWDCYRPHDVQVRMYQVVPNPAWVAKPGPYSTSHESGRSVDLTYAGALPQCPRERLVSNICLADMGTDFDDFTSRANAYATQEVSVEAQANRKRLRDAMGYGGLTVYSGEWWHFDGPGAGVQRPIINVPVD